MKELHTGIEVHEIDKYLDGSTALIDVRSPSEYGQGAPAYSVNIPILNDDERHQVGLAYKTHGAGVAQETGFRLVSGAKKVDRVGRWKKFIDKHHAVALTCWRGGMRSQIARRWLYDQGYDVERVAGGTKALRHRSIEVIDSAGRWHWIVIGGKTGVGKTEALSEYRNAIDLESLAHHRGSAFGSLERPQPNPVSFEYELSREFLRCKGDSTILVEDESRAIGRLVIPKVLFDRMQSAPIVVIEADLDERVERTFASYVRGRPADHLLQALARIERRLGGLRYKQIRKHMAHAFEADSPAAHKRWIEELLTSYYDPMYDYQLARKKNRVIFCGDRSEMSEFLDLKRTAAMSDDAAQRRANAFVD